MKYLTFLLENDLISPKKSSFKADNSCINRLLSINHEILSAFDVGFEFQGHFQISLKKKNNFMATFYGWGSTASRLDPLRGGSLLFTIKIPEIPGTQFIDLGRMKG